MPFQLDASRSNGMPPYGMGPHPKALERDAPNGRGDPAGRPYEAALVATARNGKVAINPNPKLTGLRCLASQRVAW